VTCRSGHPDRSTHHYEGQHRRPGLESNRPGDPPHHSHCLDWTLVWNEPQLHRLLTEYLHHYNTVRPHRSLDLHPPRPATRLTLIESRTVGAPPVRRVDVLGGLIHEYRRAA
jgi:hypothetical protein